MYAAKAQQNQQQPTSSSNDTAGVASGSVMNSMASSHMPEQVSPRGKCEELFGKQ